MVQLQNITEKPGATMTVIAGSGVVTSTHLFWVPLEHWILWLTFLISAFWLWAQLKVHVLTPFSDWRKRKAAKKRRATDVED